MRVTSDTKILRLTALAMALMLCLGVLVACNPGDGEGTNTDTDVPSETVSETETEGETPSETVTDIDTDTATETDTETETTPTETVYTVTVTDIAGTPLSGASVQVLLAGAAYTNGITDENGVYTFADEPAAYRVSVSLEGYTALAEDYELTAQAAQLTVALDPPYANQFTVSNVFSDDMVIQRNENVRIWGFADESQNGKKVSAEFLGVTAHTAIVDGAWELTFDVRWEANTAMGNHMRVYGDGVEITVHDVLVGDVYMIVGQSNVEYLLSTHMVHNNVKFPLKPPLMRLHLNALAQYSYGDKEAYPPMGSEEECAEVVSSSRWMTPMAKGYQDFSALAYCFGLDLMKATDNQVPVGLIEVGCAGQALSAFMPNEAAKAVEGEDAVGGFAYNYFMNPFERYAIAGMIWYQGESDLGLYQVYVEKFAAMVDFMRSTHNVVNKNFPVYIIELPSISPALMDFGMVRAVMGGIPNVVENSYMVASSDFATAGCPDQVHPDIKHLQAARLVEVVLAVTGMGEKTLTEVSGPRLVNAQWSNANKTSVILTFENVGDGLQASDGGDVRGILNTRVVKENLVPLPGVAVEIRIIAPNQIEVTSVREIVCISYNAVSDHLFGRDLNLCNSYGQIATAFSAVITEYAEGVEAN